MSYPELRKWKSQAEMLDAMQERNSRGQKRYEVDDAFRAACEARTGLGFEDSAGPDIRGTNATYDSVSGRKTSSLQINLTDRDVFESQERVRLTGELERLTQEEARVEPQARQEQRDQAFEASITNIKQGGVPQPFANAAEMFRAMRDERYRRDPDFNAAVAARAALGVPGVTTRVSDDDSQSQQA